MSKKKHLLEKLDAALISLPGLVDLLAMSSNPDGFKRENAVRRLGRLGDPSSIPYLIERANDWVPEVRTAAYDALIRLLRTGNGASFVAALPQLLHLQSCRRDDHRGLLEAVQDFLLREDNREALMGGMENPDARVARLVTQLLVGRGLASQRDLVAKGLAHADPIVRITVIDLLQGLEPDEFDAAVVKSLADPCMPVRRTAFQQLLRRDRTKGLSTARRLLFDTSASIREIAVHHLAAAGESVEDLYACALQRDRVHVAAVKCALWGWARLNCRARIEQVIQLLDADYPGIRRAALQAVTKLLGPDARPHLVVALSDLLPAVCNEAARLICRTRVAPDVPTLIEIASSSTASHVAHACCRVIRNGSKWDWLQFTLSVYGSASGKVDREMFAGEIDYWNLRFNCSSGQPNQRQINCLVLLLRSCETKLSAAQVRLLEFTIKSCGALL